MAFSATQMMYVAEKISLHTTKFQRSLVPPVACLLCIWWGVQKKVGLFKQAHGVVSQQRLHMCNVTLTCSPSFYAICTALLFQTLVHNSKTQKTKISIIVLLRSMCSMETWWLRDARREKMWFDCDACGRLYIPWGVYGLWCMGHCVDSSNNSNSKWSLPPTPPWLLPVLRIHPLLSLWNGWDCSCSKLSSACLLSSWCIALICGKSTEIPFQISSFHRQPQCVGWRLPLWIIGVWTELFLHFGRFFKRTRFSNLEPRHTVGPRFIKLHCRYSAHVVVPPSAHPEKFCAQDSSVRFQITAGRPEPIKYLDMHRTRVWHLLARVHGLTQRTWHIARKKFHPSPPPCLMQPTTSSQKCCCATNDDTTSRVWDHSGAETFRSDESPDCFNLSKMERVADSPVELWAGIVISFESFESLSSTLFSWHTGYYKVINAVDSALQALKNCEAHSSIDAS